MFKKNFCLILILLLACFLRFYQLAEVPHGMTWDEAAIGYNGFAIFNYRRDEWLQKLPVSFRSFGDYKAPLAIYQSSLFTAIFGMNLWAVRLPFAIHGVLAVLGIYLLFKELFVQDKNKNKWALWASFLMVISPWHLHYSRIGFESGMALNLSIWALYFFYRYLHIKKITHLFLASLLSISTIYAYHSSKVTVPLLFLFLILRHWSFFKNKIKDCLLVGSVSLVALLPFLHDAFFANGLSRASSTLFGQNLSPIDLVAQLLSNFFSYLSLQFLIFGKNMGNFRHGDGKFGVIEPIALILIIFYLFIKKSTKEEKELFCLAVISVILGFLPAIISEGQSSSNRSLLALPGLILLTVLAIRAIWNALNSKKSQKIFLIVLIGLYSLSLIRYQLNYYSNYAQENADDFMDGYLETLWYLRSLDRSQIKQIIFTNDYQQAYIYALFAFEVNPIAYQGGILNLFSFADKIDASDLAKENTIVVASKFDHMGERIADKIIQGSDATGRFFVYLPL